MKSQIQRLFISSLLVAVFSFAFGFGVFAQEIIFCEKHTELGEAKGVKDVWLLDDVGTKLQILYNNGKTTFDFPKLFFLIESHITEGNPDKIEINVNQQRNWDFIDYTFKKSGEYKVSVYGLDNNVLASKRIDIQGKAVPIERLEADNIEVKKEKENVDISEKQQDDDIDIEEKEAFSNIKFTKEEIDKVHQFDKAEIVFSSETDEAKKIGNSFKLKKPGTYIDVLIQNTKPISKGTITLDVWKKGREADYGEHVGSKSVMLEAEKEKINTHYSFHQIGEYKVSVFDSEDTWICSGYITIE